MPCDHVGAPELIEMAEEHLRGVPAAEWEGRSFQYTENLESGYWASVTTQIERRNGDWIVTRLDRSKEPAPQTGFAAL